MGSESISNVMDISTADDTDDKNRPISSAEMNDATVNLSRNCTHITIEKLVCFLQYLEKIHVTNATSEKYYKRPGGKRLASVMKNFNKKIDRKNRNFVNKTAI